MHSGLLSTAAQSKYLGRPTDYPFHSEKEKLSTGFSESAEILKARLFKAGMLNEQWETRINELKRRFASESYSPRSIWLSFRLLNDHTAAILKSSLMNRYFPSEFSSILLLPSLYPPNFGFLH